MGVERRKKVEQKMRYKEVTRIETKEGGALESSFGNASQDGTYCCCLLLAAIEVTEIKEFTDLGEYVSHGITWDEFNAEQERLRKAAELREKKLARIREMRRMQAEREAQQVADNEQECVAVIHCAHAEPRRH